MSKVNIILSEWIVLSNIGGFFQKKLGKSCGDYKYRLHCQVTEFETVEEKEENRPKGVIETQ